MISREQYMEHLLTCNINLQHVHINQFDPGYIAKPQITYCARLLHVISGQIRYIFDDCSVTLNAGSMLFIPVGIHREWTVPAGKKLEMEWFLYETEPADIPDLIPRASNNVDKAMVRDTFVKLRELSVLTRRIDELAIANECKTLLMRFMHDSQSVTNYKGATRGTRSKIAVSKALKILHSEYASPDVLLSLHKKVAMSENYFRLIFHRVTGVTPGEYLLRNRMRHARNILATEATLTVKEVAYQVGYTDPLYFSRVYRKFWGHPPSDERNITA